MSNSRDHDENSPQNDAGEPLPILWICGAPGTGKSVTAWELYMNHATRRVAYVDIDQLTMLAPEVCPAFALATMNLSDLVDAHRALGTRVLIVSGVIDPTHRADLEAALTGRAEVTWCLVDADDDTLRTRISARGWSEELVDMVVVEAQAWRSAGAGVCIDTVALSPSEAACEAGVLLGLRAAPETIRDLASEPVTTGDLIVIYGPRAVGKSTISWKLFVDCSARNEPTGYLDADQLGFIHGPTALREELIRRSVHVLASNFGAMGAVRTIVNGNLSPALVRSLRGSRTSSVRLDAPRDVLESRIAARGEGDTARLAGDDLAGADGSTRSAVLDLAERQREHFATASVPGSVLDVSGSDREQHVAALRSAIVTAMAQHDTYRSGSE